VLGESLAELGDDMAALKGDGSQTGEQAKKLADAGGFAMAAGPAENQRSFPIFSI
jgi:hypothetical protein